MPVQISTGRGVYSIAVGAPLEADEASVTLTLALERADGIERVVMKCRVARSLLGEVPSADVILDRLTPWLAREFEQTREAALKSIRSEHRLHEVVFDNASPGPFKCDSRQI